MFKKLYHLSSSVLGRCNIRGMIFQMGKGSANGGFLSTEGIFIPHIYPTVIFFKKLTAESNFIETRSSSHF